MRLVEYFRRSKPISPDFEKFFPQITNEPPQALIADPTPYAENYVPYAELATVSDTIQRQGEPPPIPFRVLKRHWSIPQVNEGIDFWTNLVIGNGVTLNCLDDKAKAALEKWMRRTAFNERMTNCVRQTLVYGIGCMVKVVRQGVVIGVEDMDVSNILWVWRDREGNPVRLKRVYEAQGSEYDREVNWDTDVFLRFRGYDRDFFGMSRFHSVSYMQDDSQTTYKTIGDGVIAMNDAILGTAEQTIYPLTLVEPHNKTSEALNQMKSILQQFRPRQRVILKHAPKISTADIQQNRVNYEPLIKAANARVAESMGFPFEILSGDFTSRASSKTTDELFMRTVRSYQTVVAEAVRDIFVSVLEAHPDGKWTADEIDEMALTVTFDTDSRTPFTLEEMLQLFQVGAISLEEIRQFARNRGMDLFTDDEELQAEKDAMAEMDPGGDPRQARDVAGETPKTTRPSTTRSNEAYFPPGLVPHEPQQPKQRLPEPNKKPNYDKTLKRPFIDPTQKAAQDHATRRMAARQARRKKAGKPIIRMEYRSRNDARTCKYCRALHGQKWYFNDERRPTIPRHPSCRCRWVDTATGRSLGRF